MGLVFGVHRGGPEFFRQAALLSHTGIVLSDLAGQEIRLELPAISHLPECIRLRPIISGLSSGFLLGRGRAAAHFLMASCATGNRQENCYERCSCMHG
jgi:hypothetical protein